MGESAGYSGTPLVKKLGIDAGMTVRLLNPPDDYWDLLGGGPEELDLATLDPGGASRADFTHLFAADAATLDSGLRSARASMVPNGMVWVSWPKKSSGVESEIARGDVMAAGKSAGLVDVKVCAVDETWSALKFVIPVDQRS